MRTRPTRHWHRVRHDRNVKVLVADHSDTVRTRLVARLREADVEVVAEADTLAAAVDQLAPRPGTTTSASTGAIAVVITDIMFPDSRGADVVATLRERAPSVLLIVATNELHYRRTCLGAGAHHFIDKSTEFDELAALLEAHRLAPSPPR